MAAYSGILRGASQVFVVDTVPERLKAAEKIGCIPIDFKASDPVEQIIKINGGMVDRAVDAVGYQAVDASGSKEKPNIVLDQLIMVTRPTGGLGIPGLYVPADPGAPDEQSRKGQILISFGKLFEKVSLPCCGLCRSSLTLSGLIAGHRPMQRESVQPISAGPHHLRESEAELCRVA
jgi:threonine dehydrogenase-like Zn-dependent dehydrogenase